MDDTVVDRKNRARLTSATQHLRRALDELADVSSPDAITRDSLRRVTALIADAESDTATLYHAFLPIDR